MRSIWPRLTSPVRNCARSAPVPAVLCGWQGAGPSNVVITTSVDRTVFDILPPSASPGLGAAGDSETGVGENSAENNSWRFNAQETTFNATIVVDLTSPRPVTGAGKSGKFFGTCLSLGAGAGSGFAQLANEGVKVIELADGTTICTIVDPVTQCEVGVECGSDPLVFLSFDTLAEVFGVDNPQIGISNQGCTTFDIDNDLDNTRWRCSGGRCYPY